MVGVVSSAGCIRFRRAVNTVLVVYLRCRDRKKGRLHPCRVPPPPIAEGEGEEDQVASRQITV